mgnify:CR=1 FL=1
MEQLTTEMFAELAGDICSGVLSIGLEIGLVCGIVIGMVSIPVLGNLIEILLDKFYEIKEKREIKKAEKNLEELLDDEAFGELANNLQSVLHEWKDNNPDFSRTTVVINKRVKAGESK